tara:strand:- start:391 stop:600 length:210 start_codon:yes stop_codon:yes gene_type:complete
MFDYFKEFYNYYFTHTPQKQEHQEHQEHHKQSVQVNEQPKKELILKKNDGYKNINTNKVLDILFNPVDI